LEDNVEKKEPAVGYVHTSELPSFFNSLGISLIVSTYQAQRLMTLSSATGEKMFMLMRVFERPTGLAFKHDEMAAVTRRQIWFFRDPGVIRDLEGNPLPYDCCLVPRCSHVTGDISGHECAYQEDELIVVNTRFSCLCKLSREWSFVPFWHPPFISEVTPEDRCHLNGLVMGRSGPRFVSALAETNTKEGWREHKADGGLVIEVESGEIVTRGIAMVHSPRWYDGRLWVLESGTGELQVVDLDTGKRSVVARFPGYLRGLAFYDRYAFVGLCKIRGDRETFGGLPIERMYPELKCAIYVVDLHTGADVGFIEFTKGIEELFDIHVLAGVRTPHIIGFEEDTINGIFVVNS
jgi:uncharacterized protein (TIGR03032 family)